MQCCLTFLLSVIAVSQSGLNQPTRVPAAGRRLILGTAVFGWTQSGQLWTSMAVVTDRRQAAAVAAGRQPLRCPDRCDGEVRAALRSSDRAGSERVGIAE